MGYWYSGNSQIHERSGPMVTIKAVELAGSTKPTAYSGNNMQFKGLSHRFQEILHHHRQKADWAENQAQDLNVNNKLQKPYYAAPPNLMLVRV